MPHTQREGDIRGDAHVREERVVLEHDTDVTLVWRGADDLDIAETNAAVVGADEAGEHHQQGGFAGAGGAEQGEEFAAGDVEIDLVERAHQAVGLGHLTDGDGEGAGGGQGAGGGYSPSS